MESPSVAAVFRPLEEHMGGAHEWPAWLRDLVRLERLDVHSRLSLPVNLLGNVVPPIIVAEHAAPRLVDKRACDDVHDLMARIRDGRYAGGDGKTLQYWDVDRKCLLPLAFSRVDDAEACWFHLSLAERLYLQSGEPPQRWPQQSLDEALVASAHTRSGVGPQL